MAWQQIAGPVLGLLGARREKKATQRLAEAIERASQLGARTMEKIAAPWTEAGRYALPQFKGALETFLAPRAGKPSPWIGAERERAVTEIGRGEQRALGRSRLFWRGQRGRGRGEELRIRRGATEARSEVGLRYGRAQEEFGQTATSRYMSALGLLGQMGAAAIQPAMAGAQTLVSGAISGAQTRAGGETGWAGDIAQAGGLLLGRYEAKREAEKYRKQLSDMFAKNK